MKERLTQILSLRQKRRIVDNSRVPAAVLAPIYYKQGQYYILFTKRTEKVKEHKGQISFPGGAYQDSDETLQVTALRESTEEIGLIAEDVDVLGELDDELSLASNYVISPFVGLIPWPYEFRLNSYETDEIFGAPISALLHENCLNKDTETLDGTVANSYTYHYEDKVIWGATARILNNFLDIFSRAMPNR
ncbi:NUDIX hydrolase [Chloroflexota bacterium]